MASLKGSAVPAQTCFTVTHLPHFLLLPPRSSITRSHLAKDPWRHSTSPMTKHGRIHKSHAPCLPLRPFCRFLPVVLQLLPSSPTALPVFLSTSFQAFLSKSFLLKFPTCFSLPESVYGEFYSKQLVLLTLGKTNSNKNFRDWSPQDKRWIGISSAMMSGYGKLQASTLSWYKITIMSNGGESCRKYMAVMLDMRLLGSASALRDENKRR